MEQYKSIFIVGIKGVAMCQIAVILKKMGKEVTGTDVAEEFITDEVLNNNGISSLVGFEPTLLPPDAELVLYSAAHGGTDNPIVQAAKSRGTIVLSQAELLGELLKKFKITIAVCGSHGKTTTSSLLSYALIKLGANPSYLVGSSTFTGEGQTFPGGDYNGGDYFVIEADEYGVNPPKDKTPKLEFLHPSHILCTNIDFDHPDMYTGIEQVKDVFKQFFSRDQGTVIYCQDDANLAELASNLPTKKTESYGISQQSKLAISDIDVQADGTHFTIRRDDETIEIVMSLYGEKNVLNMTAVVGVLLTLGFTPTEIAKAVRGFTGPKRRLELKYQNGDTYLFDDYGHHPAEIEASINALRKRFPQKKIIVIFQPHTFSRTKALAREFTAALEKADISYLLPIFPSAREDASAADISAGDLANGISVFSLDNKTVVVDTLKEYLKGGEVVVTMGAGDVYKIADDIIEVIKAI